MVTIRATALAAIVSLGLAGCQTLPDNASIIDRIQALAIEACAYVPTAEFILELLGLEWDGADVAVDVANAICAAVQPQAAARSSATVDGPSVRGIQAQGSFISK